MRVFAVVFSIAYGGAWYLAYLLGYGGEVWAIGAYLIAAFDTFVFAGQPRKKEDHSAD
jgi:hypothetical protein